MRHAYVLFVCLAFVGCATSAPPVTPPTGTTTQTPSQAIADVQQFLNFANFLAGVYGSFPPCVAGGSKVCSDPKTVQQIQIASAAAQAALAGAQAQNAAGTLTPASLFLSTMEQAAAAYAAAIPGVAGASTAATAKVGREIPRYDPAVRYPAP